VVVFEISRRKISLALNQERRKWRKTTGRTDAGLNEDKSLRSLWIDVIDFPPLCANCQAIGGNAKAGIKLGPVTEPSATQPPFQL
jgi:hypothetical protein